MRLDRGRDLLNLESELDILDSVGCGKRGLEIDIGSSYGPV